MPSPSTPPFVETIRDGPETLAILVRSGYLPSETTFLTPPDNAQQLGFVAYPAGSEIPRHAHEPIERSIRGTTECLVVRRGKSEMTLYNRAREEVCRRVLVEGDVVLLLGGGHGFRQIEDTLFLEVKQGPYVGIEEKAWF